MAYNYYCTYCGRELSQDTVFFDMQSVLTGSTSKENEFKILKFLVTKSELEAIVAAGTQEDMGFARCKLTLQQLMNYISNQNNLNNPTIATLKLEDVKEYVTDISFESDDEAEEEDDLFTVEVKPKEEKRVVQEDKPVSEAIRALEATDTKNEDRYFTQENLKKDLAVIYSLFANEEEYVFDILPTTEKDNEGKEVLIGYKVNAGIPRHITIVNRRVCCHCEAPVFEHAGTAEHRAVAFIGDQNSGKTSTILSLVHYAQNALQGVMEGDEIWKEAGSIDSISNIELLSPSERLLQDLSYYQEGLAPAKTKADERNDAYSATLRIKHRYQDKHYLLTFTDLPGELCNPDTGKIDGNNILNNFPVALACDAFVLCFDSETAKGGRAHKMITNACSWANEFQQYRESYNQSIGKDKGLKELVPKADSATGFYAPVMLTFTKCRELEHPEESVQRAVAKKAFDLIARTYMFDEERLLIDRNQVYNKVGELMKEFACLISAYHARLRCSPYGYAARKAADYKEKPELLFDEGEKQNHPKPKNIDKLMRWLLAVSGCIPVEGEFRPSPDPAVKTVYAPHPSFIAHTQYRAISPRGAGKDGDVQEALARCYLFENPGKFDQQFLLYYSQRAILTTQRFKAKFQRN